VPTYDYRCNACGHEFELFQSMSDKVKRKCPQCGKPTLERLIGTGAALLFKGSGFYQTDYRSESYKKAAGADKPEGKGESKPESKPDTKPDAKPEKKKDTKGDKKPKAASA
jgi:putative FmdB family regulatory protein